jgi:hypothetical protein
LPVRRVLADGRIGHGPHLGSGARSWRSGPLPLCLSSGTGLFFRVM